MGDGNSLSFVVWLVLVILACKSIVLCKCSGRYIDIYFSLKITCFDSWEWGKVRKIGPTVA